VCGVRAVAERVSSAGNDVIDDTPVQFPPFTTPPLRPAPYTALYLCCQFHLLLLSLSLSLSLSPLIDIFLDERSADVTARCDTCRPGLAPRAVRGCLSSPTLPSPDVCAGPPSHDTLPLTFSYPASLLSTVHTLVRRVYFWKYSGEQARIIHV